MNAKDQSQAIAMDIIKDLCGRSGGDAFFYGCDKEVQAEIEQEWARIVEGYIRCGTVLRYPDGFHRCVRLHGHIGAHGKAE